MKYDDGVTAWLHERHHPLDSELRLVRDIILGSDERVFESIKWKTPTFSFEGNIASFNPAKSFISLLFQSGAQIPGNHPLLVGDGRLARTVRFADTEDILANRANLESIVRAWCRWKETAAA